MVVVAPRLCREPGRQGRVPACLKGGEQKGRQGQGQRQNPAPAGAVLGRPQHPRTAARQSQFQTTLAPSPRNQKLVLGP